MTFTVSFDFDDARLLWHSAVEVEEMRNPEESGRFKWPASSSSDRLPEQELASPDFDMGTILWTETAGDALLLRGIHRAAGHQAHIMLDGAANSTDVLHAVLSSWNLREGEPPLTEEPVIAELSLVAGADEPPLDWARDVMRESIIGESRDLMTFDSSDHENHYHLVATVQLPGLALRPLAKRLVKDIGGNDQSFHVEVEYKVISWDS